LVGWKVPLTNASKLGTWSAAWSSKVGESPAASSPASLMSSTVCPPGPTSRTSRLWVVGWVRAPRVTSTSAIAVSNPLTVMAEGAVCALVAIAIGVEFENCSIFSAATSPDEPALRSLFRAATSWASRSGLAPVPTSREAMSATMAMCVTRRAQLLEP
jgi:hypothetical protein